MTINRVAVDLTMPLRSCDDIYEPGGPPPTPAAAPGLGLALVATYEFAE